jgi:hypothetical protein
MKMEFSLRAVETVETVETSILERGSLSTQNCAAALREN